MGNFHDKRISDEMRSQITLYSYKNIKLYTAYEKIYVLRIEDYWYYYYFIVCKYSVKQKW